VGQWKKGGEGRGSGWAAEEEEEEGSCRREEEEEVMVVEEKGCIEEGITIRRRRFLGVTEWTEREEMGRVWWMQSMRGRLIAPRKHFEGAWPVALLARRGGDIDGRGTSSSKIVVMPKYPFWDRRFTMNLCDCQ